MSPGKLSIESVYFGSSKKEHDHLLNLVKKCPHFRTLIFASDRVEDLLVRLKSGGVDLIFVSLQEISDREAALQFREQFQGIPILILGNRKSEDYCHSLLEVGFQSYILKEITSSLELNHMIQDSFRMFRYSDLREMLRKLKNTEKSLWQVISESRDGVIIVDKNNFILYANPVAKELFLNNSQTKMNQAFQYDLRSKSNFQVEIDSPNQEKIFIDFQITPMSWDDREVFLGTARDVSARVELEKRKDEFLNTVSHELRTPLAIIRESISQVSEGMHGEITAGQNKILQLGIGSIDRLTKLINDLLDISKIEANKFAINPAYSNLTAVSYECVENFKSLCHAKNVTLDFETNSNDAYTYFDRDAVFQVLNNILGNAVKFTAEGSIKVIQNNYDHKTEIIIRDTGPGMNEADIKKLFNRFQQVGRVKAAKGSGLGLSIAKALINLHGGDIEVKSEPGVGSEFTITLPHKNTKQVLDECLSRIETPNDVAAIFIPLSSSDEVSKEQILTQLTSLQKKIDRHVGKELSSSLRSPDGIYAFLSESPSIRLENFLSELEKEIPEAKDFELVPAQRA